MIICVLVVSIVYQAGFLFTNAKGLEVFQQEQASIESDEQNFETSEVTNSNNGLEEELFINILRLGIPYNNEKSTITSSIQTVVSYLTKIDINDPKTLITRQMPIMESYEDDGGVISQEEQDRIYNITASKPLNNDEVSVSETQEKPLVLIYHTHTTESYTSSAKYKIKYTRKTNYRSLEEEHNMVAVGDVITNVIEEKYGIKVIHDTTVHDYPNYEVSYKKSLETIEKNLEKYPTIKYVFDIHRDGFTNNEANKKKYATVVNNIDTAKVMMVVGLNHKNSDVNSKFSDEVYNKMKEMYPEIAIPSVKRSTATYNQFVRDYAMLFEVGSNLSTLEEALSAGNLLGDVIGEIIKEKEF